MSIIPAIRAAPTTSVQLYTCTWHMYVYMPLWVQRLPINLKKNKNSSKENDEQTYIHICEDPLAYNTM